MKLKVYNLEQYIFLSLLLFLPTNIGLHFIQPYSYNTGLLIDYLIPTLYLTDILIILLGVLYIFRILIARIRNLRFLKWPKRTRSFSRNNLYMFLPALFILSLLFSVFYAHAFGPAIYKFVRLLLYIFLMYYVSLNIDFTQHVKKIIFYLSLGSLFESILGICQFLYKHTIFGYWFLGESTFNLAVPSVKKVTFFAYSFVPAYGTLPHPNVFGAFLAFSIILQIYMVTASKKLRLYYMFNIFISVLALILSASFVSYFALLVSVFWLYFFQDRGSLILRLFHYFHVWKNSRFMTAVVSTSYSIQRRLDLSNIALNMFSQNPLLGVGLNNFTVIQESYGSVYSWERFVQPVHNIFLLVLAESGLLSFLLFSLLFFYVLMKSFKISKILFCVCIELLIFGLFDHFLYTLPQGLLMFWLTFGFVFSTIYRENNRIV